MHFKKKKNCQLIYCMSLSLSPQYRSWNFRKAHVTCRYLLSPCRVSLRQLMSPCQILQKTPCRHFDSRGNANCTTCIYYCHLSIVIYLEKRGVLQIEYSQLDSKCISYSLIISYTCNEIVFISLKEGSIATGILPPPNTPFSSLLLGNKDQSSRPSGCTIYYCHLHIVTH